MGNLMAFYAGDARKIGDAIEDVDSDIDLRAASFVAGHVDFSLHLDDNALDALVETVCRHRHRAPTTLRSSLAEHVAGPSDPMEQEYSADVVSPDLVHLLASLTDADIALVASAWTASWGGTTNPDVERALSGLRDVCALASSRSLSVVFSWSV
jgi:hypothetical protein